MSRCLWGTELWVHGSNQPTLQKFQRIIDIALKKCVGMDYNATEA